MAKRVVTINRTYGSNGRVVGIRLAEALGIHFYDKELLKLAQEQKNIPYEELVKVDEQRPNPWRYPVDDPTLMEGQYRFYPMNDVLFHTQEDIIRALSEKEDCLIVGRCANHILSDVPHVLRVCISAPYAYRVDAIMERADIDRSKAASLVKKTDKQRRDYYEHYTGQNWLDLSQYDICLDSSRLSEKQIITTLAALYETL
ncbi:cytidylate kinase-like family protein [Qiania dongpingensis]|uniref:Cytidylate kinase-like family protein n=1 Tax=Qiania dongpingensis TaxID=2763669 RepID=A0A7G9G767_9FIRM|nr:cytidylate kinase-like family protein [Qiania dongpingensis]QNM06649.1 cytidylate kinase-like family protein [Qiania dongpingensis]